MYKLAIKFLIITLVLTGVCLVFSSNSKALAASCPSGNSAPGDWGNDSNGEGAGVMSSLVMRARDTSGNPLNPHFTLHSEAPASPDDAQIYHWPIGSGGSVSNTDDWPQHGDFQFGTHLSGDGGAQCNGWVVLGPGIDGNVGNGWVLNCKTNGTDNIFWISHLDNPSGQTGRWEMLDSSGNSLDSDVNSGSSPHIKFPVVNGANMRFTFVWHPSTPPPQPAGTCTYLQASNTGNYNNQSKRTHVVINGTNHDVDENIPDDGGAGGNNTGTYTKNYYYQPQHNAITVTVTTQYYTNGANPHWQDLNTTNIRTTNDPCFTAQCSISYVDGTGPNGIVLAGQQMHIHGTYWNTSPSPDDLPIWSPALNATGSQNGGNNHSYTLFSSPPPAYKGWPYDFDIYMTAPSNVTRDDFHLTPIYFDGAAIGSACPGGVPVGGEPIYQQFGASVSAKSDPTPTIENPTNVAYGASMNLWWINPPPGLPSRGINNPTTAAFYQKLASGAQTTPCSPSSYSSSGPYSSPSPPGGDTIWSHSCAIAPGSFAAGDEFCSTVTATYNGGFVGPDGNVVSGTGPATDTKCPRVVNEPYFKVFNGNISAGGDFDQCTTNGGELAGYNDNSDPPGAQRGAGTQLSALALIRITGVASAQTDIARAPPIPGVDLTFANTNSGDISLSGHSPSLGGNFGSCLSLTNAAPDPNKPIGTVGATVNLGSITGQYSHTGNLEINAGTLTPGQNVSLFVTGDVSIRGDITYDNSGAAVGTVPSLVVHATGNIYIDPSVAKLSGLYIAQKNGANGGKIYTCADTVNHFTFMSASNLYNGCKKQLRVYGSFVADQINLMRGFGSLRDEGPTPGPPPGSQIGLVWSCGGGVCNPPGIASMHCTRITESSEPNSHTWNDNNLCVPASSPIQMAWTNRSTSDLRSCISLGGNKFRCVSNKDRWSGDGRVRRGTPVFCTQWNASDPNGWNDNYLCTTTDEKLNFRSSVDPSQYCNTRIIESSDPNGQWATGYYLCEPQASPGGGAIATGPPFTHCSNDGGQINDKSCGGEIFEFSPELYLSDQSINESNNGAPQFQVWTNLPPVL